MHVVLVNPPIRLPEAFAHYPMFSSLGLLTNAAWLRVSGHDVHVVDAFSLSPRLNLRDDGDGMRHVGAEVDELARAVESACEGAGEPVAVVIAITMFSDMNRHESLVPATAQAIGERLPSASIGLADLYTSGMNYFAYDPGAVLRETPAAAWLLIGEGEPTLPPLLDCIAAGAPPDLPRVARLDGSGELVFDDSAPESIDKLDRLPPPAFDLLDMDNYFSAQADAIRANLVHEYHVVERQLPLMTSRGCPYRCNFCTNQVLGLPWRGHSAEHLRRIVLDLRDRYNVDRFLFLDDNININEKRFRDLVHMLAEERIPWDAVNGYRADRLDAEMVRAIKQAGNTKITVSAESGDPELLDQLIGKRLKLSSVVKVARLCDSERMPLQVHYIVGIPGETKAQMNKTLEFATMLFEMHGAWPLLQHAIPFPGTRLFCDCEEKGYFVQEPFEVPGTVLEVQSIIRTPEFLPGEVVRMKRNAQHLLDTMQALVYVDLDATPDLAQIRTELERGAFLGGRELFLGGSDPTLRADLPEIADAARALDFRRITAITAAHGFADADAEAARGLADALDHLVVPLHGPDPRTHDAITLCPGSFERTLVGLRRARQSGLRSLELTCTVAQPNLGALGATVRAARRLAARGIHLIVPAPDEPVAEAGLVAGWTEVQPRLVAALRQAPRGFVTIQGVPLCLMREPRGALRPSPPWVLARTRRLKARRPRCQSCVGLVLCGGLYSSEHDQAYGFTRAAGIADRADGAVAS